MARLFAYTYSSRLNYEASKQFGIFGARKNQQADRILELKFGDLIVIRNKAVKRQCEFLGACLVVGRRVFDQGATDSDCPIRDYLWPDEVAASEVLYPFRVYADFVGPKQPRTKVDWDDLFALGFTGSRFQPLATTQQWAKKPAGNYFDDLNDMGKISKLLGLS